MTRARRRIGGGLLAGAMLLLTAPGAVLANERSGIDPDWLERGREVLADGDGWGSAGAGTTGGSAADDAHVFVVRTWPELRAALGGTGAHNQSTPRLIFVDGEIRAFGFDDPASGLPTCDDIAATVSIEDAGGVRPFTMAEYIATFAPDVWGWARPSGPVEDARAAAARAQTAQVRQRFGSNVTLMGLGDDARIVGAHLSVQGVSNVILRNLQISDAYDCFPEWDPQDGSAGNWNSLYDNVSVHTSRNVWADHLTLDDGDHPRQERPTVHGRPFEVHDGLLDITHSSDLVTVSYTVFDNHDKTNLVGSSDSRLEDRGTLRSTWHHNLWDDVGQRAPRVRFGDVDVYNNLSRLSAPAGFDYFWGAGVESSIYAEKNVFELPGGVPVSRIIRAFGGTQLHASQNLVNGVEVDVLAAFNASASPTARLAPGARWVPQLRTVVHDVREVRDVVLAEAGSGRLGAAGS